MRGLLIESKKRFHRRSCVEIADWAGNTLLLPGVQIPDDFAVGGVKERNAEAVPVSRPLRCAGRVALGLFQHVLRIHRDFLGFDDAEQNSVDEQGVVGGAVGSGKLLNRDAMQRGEVQAVVVSNNFPGRRQGTQSGVYAIFPRQPFRFVKHTHADSLVA